MIVRLCCRLRTVRLMSVRVNVVRSVSIRLR